MIDTTPNTLRVSAPGRICLFGEHQDYLRLPVIPCAISLRLGIAGMRRTDMIVSVALPDIRSEARIDLRKPLRYEQERDYLRSGIKVLQDEGLAFPTGFDCTVRGEIPIGAGTSSSSALVVAWLDFLTKMTNQYSSVPPGKLAHLAHKAEVLEFHEPGGMMDHYSCVFGGILFVNFYPTLSVERLDPQLHSFVLGDSLQPKDTKAVLSRIRHRVQRMVHAICQRHPEFSLQTVPVNEVDRYVQALQADEEVLLRGTLRNRDITLEARNILTAPEVAGHTVGALLNEHQSILRDTLGISTPKIDRMLDAALQAGAYGGKINGSGGGGCMFAYAPEHPDAVAEAIERAGGKAFVVHIDQGVRSEQRGGMQ